MELLRASRSLAAGILLGVVVTFSVAILSGFVLTRERLERVVQNAFSSGELEFMAHTDEDYFTECSLLTMLYLRRDNVFLNSIDTRFVLPVGHPCQDLQLLVAPGGSPEAVREKQRAYPNYFFGSRYVEAFVLSFLQLRGAKLLYAIFSYGSVAALFLGAWRNSREQAFAVFWICLFLLFAFSMHRFGHNLAHAPGFFVGFTALGVFLAARDRFQNPANRIVFFGFLGTLIAFFDLLHGSIPVVLSLAIVLNHLFYVMRKAHSAVHRSPAGYFLLAVRQASTIFLSFLVAYGVLTGLRLFLFSNIIEGGWQRYTMGLTSRLSSEIPEGFINFRDVIQKLWVVGRFQLTPGGIVPATWILFISLAAWIFAICLLPVLVWRQRRESFFVLTDIFVIAIAAAGVLAWYRLFPQHTYIHVLFIVRTVALPASCGFIAATIMVRSVAAAGWGGGRWAFASGAVLAFLAAACVLDKAWASGMTAVVNTAKFIKQPTSDKVSCSPLGLKPDGKQDGLIEISLSPSNPSPPLALIGLRSRRSASLPLLLERSKPGGAWSTGPMIYVLGITAQAGGELINREDGSIDTPTGRKTSLWGYFCRDEQDTPDSFYTLHVGNAVLKVDGQP